MTETVLLVLLIVVLFLVTVISIIAVVKLRRKIDGLSAENLDKSFEVCIGELNKMGNIIKSDIDAKYKEILFLYNLMDDKHKQIEALVSKNNNLTVFDDMIKDVLPAATLRDESEPPRPLSPTHKVILQMSERGQSVADIARELGIGQGEVKLILNISNR